MPKKIFSAQEWENVPSEQLPVVEQKSLQDESPLIYNKVEQHTLSYKYDTTNLEEDIEKVMSEVETHSIDIAPNYKEWLELGFALADGLGEVGRGYYHRLSSFYPNYSREETDKQYNQCLNARGSGITISTLFHLARKAGISISPNIQNGKTDKWQNEITNLPNTQNGKTVKWIKDEEELPTFSEEVFQNLPPFLSEVVANAISDDDRDIVLLGALSCLSACFTNVCGVYDERIVYPNLYLFVVADAGMGKGALALCRELVVPINRKLHELSEQLEQEYKTAVAAYIKDKKSFDGIIPKEPPMRMLIVPANSSASSFLRILADNDGVGLLFESEGDTLSQTLRSDYGNYSDVLRKAFHHESVSRSRRKDREYSEVNNPRLSVALAGTPEQVRRLIPDAENGLMSRFIFYTIRFRRGIRNVFATSDISQSKNAIFQFLGDRFCHQQEEFLKRGSFTFSIPSELQQDFITYLVAVNEECCEEVDNRMQGVIRRLGLIAYRIMMLLTAIREMDNATYKDTQSSQLVCTEYDYRTAMSICDTLLYHAVFIYRKLSNADSKAGNNTIPVTGVATRRNRLYNLLPDTFSKKEYDDAVSALGENGSTAAKWIEVFIRSGILRRIEQGRYAKLKE